MSRNRVASFRRLSTGEQLSRLRGKQVTRKFVVERAGGINESDRTVWISIASEEPYERWWGVEILDLQPSSIRLGRLAQGAPLLIGHDPGDQVGVIDDFEVGADLRLRVMARFGRSDRAEEIWRDVLDGIRHAASVGYFVHDLVLERTDGPINTYRVTDWEPFEASLVPVPADPTVGVGRSAQPTSRGTFMRHDDVIDDDGAEGRPLTRRERRAQARSGATDEDAARGIPGSAQAERERMRDILACGDLFPHEGGPELARRLLADPAATVETFKALMFESQRDRQKPLATAEPNYMPGMPFGSGAREMLEAPKHFRGPDAQESAYRAGQWFRALYGNEDAKSWCRFAGVEVRALSSSAISQGGVLVPTELSTAIVDNANTYGIFREYADSWPMKTDTLSVPRSTTDPTPAFTGENNALSDTSDPAFDGVTLSAKKAGTIVRIPTELMEDSPIAVADRVAFQIGRGMAKLEDQCGFIGDGTSTYGGMQGLFSKIIVGSLAGKVTAAAGHDTFAEIDATDLANLISALPEYAHEGAKFYCSQVAWALVFARLMAAAGGNAASDLAGKFPRAWLGYPVVISSVLPAGPSTDYTGLAMIGFGDLRRSSSMGARRDLRIEILTERYAEYDQIGVKVTERFDIVNHSLGDTTTAGPMVALIGGT